MGWIHTIACLIAIPAGAYVLVARKGTRRHRQFGWWYAGSMLVQAVTIMAVYHFDVRLGKNPQTGPHIFGMFHWMALATLVAVLLAVFAASRQKRVAWAHVHAQTMLFSYYLLIGGLVNEMVVRILPLRHLAMTLSPHARNAAATLVAREGQTACMMIWLVLAVYFVLKVMRDRTPGVVTTGHPLRYSGGLFVACAGAGIAIGGVLGMLGMGFMAGAILGFIAARRSAVFVRPRWGRPSMPQLRVMLFAIGLEIVIFSMLGAAGFFQKHPPTTVFETAMGIVGAHFLILRFSHGPFMLALGTAVLAWLGLGHILHLPLQFVALGDGLIKLGFGLAMAWPLLKPALPFHQGGPAMEAQP